MKNLDWSLYHLKMQLQLQQDFEQIGVVLEFEVSELPDIIETPDIGHHRQAIAQALAAYDKGVANYHERLPYPRWLENYPEISDVESAVFTPLDISKIKALDYDALSKSKNFSNCTWFEALWYGFNNPPHSLAKIYSNIEENKQYYQQLWQQFCDFTGLYQPDFGELVVLDWVGYGLSEKEEIQRASWSSYFAEGLEWWGIWCLTIYNPEQRTLAVVLASTSD